MDGVTWAIRTSKRNLEHPALTIDALLNECHNLVVLDRQQNMLRFAHLSVREFLETRLEFTSPEANKMATETCLALLTSATPLDLKIAFHVYAIVYWPAHAQQCQDLITHLISEFLGSNHRPSKLYKDWLTSISELSRPVHINNLHIQPLSHVVIKVAKCLSCASDPPDPILAAAYFGF